ncbi:MAG: hypothetical protein AB1847_00020 [bacterium]
MRNLLFEDIEYKIDETPFGTWRRFVYPDGHLFEEFTSHRKMLGLPLVHYTRGKCPETGKRIVAKGIIAIGRLAMGGLAVGHASGGIIAIGQLGLGILIGIGQGSTGFYAIGQLAIGVLFGLGQVATGYIAIGQFGFGRYVLAQLGYGRHVWDARGATPAARRFFQPLMNRLFR